MCLRYKLAKKFSKSASVVWIFFYGVINVFVGEGMEYCAVILLRSSIKFNLFLPFCGVMSLLPS
jgi:hypothetical protein